MGETTWGAALKAVAAVISDLTPNFHTSYVELKVALIRDALASDDETADGMQAWWRLLLLDKLLFHKGGEAGESLNGKLRGQLQAAKDGEWLNLIAELLEEGEVVKNVTRAHSDAALAKRVKSLARQDSWRKAISAISSSAAPDRSLKAWDKLKAELPSSDSSCPCGSGETSLTSEERTELRSRIAARIRNADGAASAGLLGSAANMWKLLVKQKNSEVSELVVSLFERVAVGRISRGVRQILMHSDLLAAPRPDGRVRPVEVPSFVRRIAIGALMGVLSQESASAAGPCQYGLRTADGCVVAYSIIEQILSNDSSLVVASVDVGGAHSNIRRDAVERICNEEAPRLGHLMRLWYHDASPKTWRGAQIKTRTSSTGVGQGFQRPVHCSVLACGG